MKKRAIIFILSLLFIVLACSKGDKNAVKAVMPYSTAAPIPNSNIGTGPSVEDWQDESRFVTSGIYTYRVIDESNKTIEIRKINTDDKELVIPSTIDGYNVVSIGYGRSIYDVYYYYDVSTLRLFEEGSGVEKVTFPESIEGIGYYAFYKCEKLKEIVFPNKVIKLGESCFKRCKCLKDVRLPDGVIIEAAAFYNCSALDKIYMKGFINPFRHHLFNNSISDWYLSQGDSKDKSYYQIVGEHFYTDVRSEKRKPFIKRLHVDKNVKYVKVKQDIVYDIMKERNVVECVAKNIYISGKKTKLEYVSKDKATIYTVKGAKAITTAKKNKLPYLYKTSKPVKVKNNKWKKVKTTTVTNKYNKTKKKWQETRKKSSSVYKVYAKKTKAGKYKLVETTKKTHTSKKYKFVKVKVDLAFE